MKKKTILIASLVMLMACSFTSCQKKSDKFKTVVINDDGTTSNGSRFVDIDDQNFYLDYVKYSVVQGHLVVSGYDAAGVDGKAKIASAITYKGNAYEVLGISEKAFRSCESRTSITIPNSVTSIGDEAFYYCTGLTSIILPNSVTSIGGWAFAYCSSLTSITIPNSVNSIGDEAFYGCDEMEIISVASGNATYDSRENCNAIIESSSNTLIAGCKRTTIPNSVTSIGNGAFAWCEGLTSIILPNSVTSIGDWAFAGCTGLTSVTIPNSVTSIGESTFVKCSSLTSITIPNSVTRIGDGAFAGCSGLTSVTIPNSVTSIGDYAFDVCEGLTSIHCKPTTPPTTYGISDSDTYKRATLYVPKGYLSAYEAADGWNSFAHIVEEE